MTEIVNIYCDESCHLEHDHQKAMVLGAIWCNKDEARRINERIREIKESHNLSRSFEIKWTKISPAKKKFYLDLVNYFFDDDDLHFRALIIPDKSKLNHSIFRQTHDDWYYKMFFDLLKVIIDPSYTYKIYIDYKDTQGRKKIAKLHEVLANARYDFSRKIIMAIQTVRSNEIELLQLTDLLTGAISYVNRDLSGNSAKEEIIELIKKKSGYSLLQTTLLRENKVNIFRWRPMEVDQ